MIQERCVEDTDKMEENEQVQGAAIVIERCYEQAGTVRSITWASTLYSINGCRPLESLIDSCWNSRLGLPRSLVMPFD